MKILTVLFFSLGLSACSSNSSSNSTHISTDNIQGAWEIASISYEGKTVPYHNETEATRAGYPNSHGKVQYQIAGNKFRVIDSDEVAVQFYGEAEFQLLDNKIVTPNKNGNHLSGFTILSLGAATMTVKPEGADPDGLTLTLMRINEGDLATHKLTPIPQHLEYTFVSKNHRVSDSADDIYGSRTNPDGGTFAYCHLRKNSDGTPLLNLGFYSYSAVSSDGRVTVGGDQPDFSLVVDGHMNFNVASETLAPALNTFSANFNKNGQRIYFDQGTNCSITVKRNRRMLDVNGTCKVKASPDRTSGNSEQGDLHFKQSCLLNF